MANNGYPFQSRKQIVDRIAADPLFAAECIRILEAQHGARATGGVGAGWAASHARTATELAARLAAGDPSAADLEAAQELAGRYSKRLAAHFRARDLAERPELNAVAAVFGVGLLAPVIPTTTASVVVADPAVQPTTVTEATSPSQPITPVVVASPVTTKRRGRPVGSKNKPKEQPKTTRRR